MDRLLSQPHGPLARVPRSTRAQHRRTPLTRKDRQLSSNATIVVTVPRPSPDCKAHGLSVLPASAHPNREDGVCLLVVTTVAAYSTHLQDLARGLNALCAAHGWVRALVNVFRGQLRANLLHSCAAASHLPGFKTLLWKHALTAKAVEPFSHVFLVDSDMSLAPRRFDLTTFLRLAHATNVSIMAPAPYGYGNGLNRINDECGQSDPFHARCGYNSKCVTRCRADPDGACSVCRQTVVEVKAPLFTRRAWTTIHRLMFQNASDEALTTDYKFDLAWCDLANHHVHGCDPRKGTNCIHRVGEACAVSYVTPMHHRNDRAISSLVRDFNNNKADISRYFTQSGLETYVKQPSWKPPRSLLNWRTMCWSAGALRKASTALRSWEGFNVSSILPLKPSRCCNSTAPLCRNTAASQQVQDGSPTGSQTARREVAVDRTIWHGRAGVRNLAKVE